MGDARVSARGTRTRVRAPHPTTHPRPRHATPTETGTALFETHSGEAIFRIELQIDLLTSPYPYYAVGGTVVGASPEAPKKRVPDARYTAKLPKNLHFARIPAGERMPFRRGVAPNPRRGSKRRPA